MTKFSSEFKLSVVQFYISSHSGYRRTSQRFGVTSSNLRHWIALYRAHGVDGFKKTYIARTAEEKLAVLRYMQDQDVGHRAAAAHFNIPGASMVLHWQKLYNQGGIAALANKPKGRPPMTKSPKPYIPSTKPVSEMSPEELMRELEYRRAETAYLKKLEALAQAKALDKQKKSK
jgi:transposase